MKELFVGGEYEAIVILDVNGIPYEVRSDVFGTLRLMRLPIQSEEVQLYSTKQMILQGKNSPVYIILGVNGTKMDVTDSPVIPWECLTFSPFGFQAIQHIGTAAFAYIAREAVEKGEALLCAITFLKKEMTFEEEVLVLEQVAKLESQDIPEKNITVRNTGDMVVMTKREGQYNFWLLAELHTGCFGVLHLHFVDGQLHVAGKTYTFTFDKGLYALVEQTIETC